MDETALPFMIFKSGNNATGNKDVTASGMASVVHQTAISSATANVFVTAGLPGSRSANNRMDSEANGVIIKHMTDFNFIGHKI